ncbi:STAS domain-containing protein [Actinomycetes bacterium KLBMP 9797]
MSSLSVNMTESDHPSVIMRLAGDIDDAATTQLRRALVDAIVHRRAAQVVVDLCLVTHLDPTAIGTLYAAYGAALDVDVPLTFRTSA